MELKDKVAIVTGGASGLGEATVRRYQKHGAKTAIFDMNEERGLALAQELGADCRFFPVDVTSETSAQQAVDSTLEAYGALHICNNFAGIPYAAKTYDPKKGLHALDAFKKVIDVNLVGTFNMVRLAAEAMSKNEPVTDCGQRGVIINTASVAGFEGQMGQVAYSASKGGIIGMTLVIARDLAKLGIRCNTLVPGLMHTPLFDTFPEHVITALESSVLNPQRLGNPDEIALMAQQIVENNYVNGECIRVDGGIRMTPR
ncbi:MAG: 3-hydroxyacyl-CoA dehydrogenase [Lysobacterales bacterium]